MERGFPFGFVAVESSTFRENSSLTLTKSDKLVEGRDKKVPFCPSV